MAPSAHKVLIRDDGELDEVRSLLAENGVEFADASPHDETETPTHLLISSGSHAVSILKRIGRRRQSHHFLHVVVIDRASRSLRAMLERHGCDVVLQQPVHPTVLRLLTQRALYPGQEKRQAPRVAIGEEIKLKSGLFSRSATLAELSIKGCGLITSQPCDVGSQLKLTLPRTLTDGEPLALTGNVVGSQSGLEHERGRHSVAVVFTGMTRGTQQKLQRIMKSHAAGPTGRLAASPGTPTAQVEHQSPAQPAPAHQDAKSGSASSDRRNWPRGEYTQSVLARGAGTTHSLIGRDLSLGGMRVAAEPGLTIGDRLHLAVYGNAGVPPVIVSAEVVRDDGDEGLGLSFGSLTKAAQSSLEAIVDGLKKLDSCNAGTVVSEVLQNP